MPSLFYLNDPTDANVANDVFVCPDANAVANIIANTKANAEHNANPLATQELSVEGPTRIDAAGQLGSGADVSQAAASIVTFSAAPLRLSLVTHSEARVVLGAQPVNGVALLVDRDRIFIGEREFLVGLDALPVQREAPKDSLCTVCKRKEKEFGGAEFACPRCGLRACEQCWRGFRNDVCMTALCDQPAALDRQLWTPSPTDFMEFRET